MQIDVDFIHNQRNTNTCMAFSVALRLVSVYMRFAKGRPPRRI